MEKKFKPIPDTAVMNGSASEMPQPKKRKRMALDPELKARIDARKSADRADKAIGRAWTVLCELDAPGLTQAALFIVNKLSQDGLEQVAGKVAAMLTKPIA